MKEEKYENYPMWIVILSNLIKVLGYAIGAIILAGFGIVVAMLCYQK